MEKFRRDFNKMMNNVSVPSGGKLDSTVNMALELAKKEGSRNSYIKHRIWASIASIFVLAIGSILFTTYLLGAADDLEDASILFRYGDAGIKRMVEEGRVADLSLVAIDKNIKVTVEEGYIDNSQLMLSYRVEMLGSQPVVSNNDRFIDMNVYVDGRKQSGITTSGIHNQGSSTIEELLRFGDSWRYILSSSSDNPEIKFEMNKINGVEGNWRFVFQLEKEAEYIQTATGVSEFIKKEDEDGNVFELGSIELTPPELKFNARTRLMLDEADEMSLLDMLIIGSDKEGDTSLQYWSGLTFGSFLDFSYEPGVSPTTVSEQIYIPRGDDIYTYRVMPYITTYKGEVVPNDFGGKGYLWNEIVAPIEVGAVVETETPYKVMEVIETEDMITILYETEQEQPLFPILANPERENSEYQEPGTSYYRTVDSFKYVDGGVEVNYPKVDVASYELLMYDVSYKFYPDLEIEINLKE